MPTTKTFRIVAALALLALPLSAAEQTVDDVIAKHIAARGGQEAWRAIDSLRLTGTFQAFSRTNPFTLHRLQDGRYHMDHMLGDKTVVAGFDGDDAWWDNRWLQAGAQPITGADRAVFDRELDFPNPFFDHAERGHTVTFAGEDEVEGETLLRLDVTRADESQETWYLHPETYLEVFRDSPGSDFGRPMTQRTFFDDFREVGDVKIPFYTETQWYTRYRVMEVHDAEVGVAVDEGIFRRPAPPGMENFQDLAGTWNVKAERRNGPQGPFQESEQTSELSLLLGGAMIEERTTTARGTDIIRTLSYDRGREIYRMTTVDSRDGMMDVQIGGRDDAGAIVVSNADTGTSVDRFGTTVFQRTTLAGDDETMTVQTEVSIDGGESWFVVGRSTYTRAAE